MALTPAEHSSTPSESSPRGHLLVRGGSVGVGRERWTRSREAGSKSRLLF